MIHRFAQGIHRGVPPNHLQILTLFRIGFQPQGNHLVIVDDGDRDRQFFRSFHSLSCSLGSGVLSLLNILSPRAGHNSF